MTTLIEAGANAIEHGLNELGFGLQEGDAQKLMQAALTALQESGITEGMADAFWQAREEYEEMKRDQLFPRPALPDFLWDAMLKAAQGEG